jgi:hypothetical protein
MNKYLILLLTLLLIGNASATQINVIYTSNLTTAELYYCNGSEKYFYNTTNTLSDNFNTIMISGHNDNSDDLIENPLIVFDKLLFILTVVFFSFMFLVIIYVVKKVIG